MDRSSISAALMRAAIDELTRKQASVRTLSAVAAAIARSCICTPQASTAEVEDRMDLIRPGLLAQHRAALDGVAVRSSSQLVSSDVHVMGNAAKHQWEHPIGTVTAGSARRSQRGQRGPRLQSKQPSKTLDLQGVTVKNTFLHEDVILTDVASSRATRSDGDSPRSSQPLDPPTAGSSAKLFDIYDVGKNAQVQTTSAKPHVRSQSVQTNAMPRPRSCRVNGRATQTEVDSSSTCSPLLTCVRGHQLVCGPSSFDDHHCDLCSCNIDKNAMTGYCAECEFDLCPDCQQDFLASDESPE